MTRIKKTRKSAPLAVRKKDSPKKSKPDTKMTTRKRKGLKTGAKYSEEKNKAVQSNQPEQQDPRFGSKEPIDLSPKVLTTEPKAPGKTKPQVQLKKQKDNSAQLSQWQAELAKLEQDEALMDLLDRHEDGDELTAKELTLLNKKTARHAFLIKELGVEAEYEEAEEETVDQIDKLLDSDWSDTFK